MLKGTILGSSAERHSQLLTENSKTSLRIGQKVNTQHAEEGPAQRLPAAELWNANFCLEL